MQITAAGGELPADTLLVVQYQGTVTERYALSAPPEGNEDVCCRPLLEPVEGELPTVRCREPDAGGRDAASDGRADAAPGQVPGVVEGGLHDSGDGSSGDAAVGQEPDAADGGRRADGGEPPVPAGPKALLCQLWTDGEAEIRLSASGYEGIVRVLDAKVEEARCGLETVDVRIELSGLDAGP